MRAAWQVTGGSITGAQQRGQNRAQWQITLRPESDGDMVVVLPAATGCAGDHPICTAGNAQEPLWTRLERRLDGPATRRQRRAT